MFAGVNHIVMTDNNVILMNRYDNLVQDIKCRWGGSTATRGGITDFTATGQTMDGLI